MKIIWDENKNKENIKKHKVSFEEAETVFFDPKGKIIHDPDHSNEEERFIILGLSKMLNLLVVCHCYREDDEIIRIITARKATKQETKSYGEK
ncbi:MAG: BrnT family toxin [Treponema sp.]|nr:BrnT family toxin [Treponema sp.]